MNDYSFKYEEDMNLYPFVMKKINPIDTGIYENLINDLRKKTNELNIFNISFFGRFFNTMRNYSEAKKYEKALKEYELYRDTYNNLEDFVKNLDDGIISVSFNASFAITKESEPFYKNKINGLTIYETDLHKLKKYISYKKMNDRLPEKGIKEGVRKI